MEDKILVHHGINGQKWGDRRYQNEDGSLTPLGRIHYGVGEARDRAKIEIKKTKAFAKSESKIIKAKAKAEIAKTRAAAKAQAKADKERIKAEAKAYKDKRQKNDEVEKEKIRADKDIEKEKIRTDKELELAAMREHQREVQEDRKLNKEMMKQGEKAEKKRINIENETVKKALKITAAVGIGYLLYKTLSGNGGIQGVSSSTMSAGQEVVNKNKGSLVSKIFNKSGKVSRSDAYSTLLGNKNLSKDEAAYYTRELFSNGTKSVPKATFDKFMELLENKVGHSALSTEGQILMHSEENNMKDQIICHHGIKGQKWGVIRKLEDSRTSGRTQTNGGSVSGTTKYGEGMGGGAHQNYSGRPGITTNYEFTIDENEPYREKFGSYAPKTRKEYLQFVKNDAKSFVSGKGGYEKALKELDALIKKYSDKKGYKLSSGEVISFKDILPYYKEAYAAISNEYQEEVRNNRKKENQNKKKRLLETVAAEKLEAAKKNQIRFGNEKGVERAKQMGWFSEKHQEKPVRKELKRANKIKHSSSDGMILIHSEDICHHGIKGQKWGVRRWQYEDGTLTPEGKIHYSTLGREHYDMDRSSNRHTERAYNRINKSMSRNASKAEKRLASGKDATKQMAKALANAERLNDEESLRRFAEASATNSRNALINTIGMSLAMLGGFGMLRWSPSAMAEVRSYRKESKEILEKYKNMSAEELEKKFNETLGKTEKVKKVYDREDVKAERQAAKAEKEAQKQEKADKKMKQEYEISVDKEEDTPEARNMKTKIESGAYNTKILNAVTNEMYDRYVQWNKEDGNKIMSKQEFRDTIRKAGINSGFTLDNGTAVVYLNDGGTFYNHGIGLEITPDGKIQYIDLEG